MAGLQIWPLWKQNKNQRSAAREQVWQHDGRETEAAKHRAEEKDIGRF